MPPSKKPITTKRKPPPDPSEELLRLMRKSAEDKEGRVNHGVPRGVAYDDAREVDTATSGKRTRKRMAHVPAGIRPVTLESGDAGQVDFQTVELRTDHVDPALLFAARRLERTLQALRTTGHGPSALAPAVVAAYETLFGWPVASAWAEELFARLQYAKLAEHDSALLHPELFHDVTPVAILRQTAAECEARGLTLPAWIADPALIAWLLTRYSPGRGGGRSRKVSDTTIRTLLLDPKALLRAIVADQKRMGSKNVEPAELRRFALMIGRLRASLIA